MGVRIVNLIWQGVQTRSKLDLFRSVCAGNSFEVYPANVMQVMAYASVDILRA